MAESNEKVRRPDSGATDQIGEGPVDIEGAEASELPNHGRGAPDSNIGQELSRKLPGQTGGVVGDGEDVGLAGTPDIADSRDHGHRKHN